MAETCRLCAAKGKTVELISSFATTIPTYAIVLGIVGILISVPLFFLYWPVALVLVICGLVTATRTRQVPALRCPACGGTRKLG